MGSVSEQTLIELLKEGSEATWLDYKDTLDLTQKRDLVELAKDIGAMQVDGGYIVVGADNAGQPSKRFTLNHTRRFDEASLRQQLEKWIPGNFDLRTAIHEVEGQVYALIFTGPRRERHCVFKETGRYEGRDGKPVEVFQKGQTYTRRGTASVLANQSDWERIWELRSAMHGAPPPAAEDDSHGAVAPNRNSAIGGPSDTPAQVLAVIGRVLEAEFDTYPGDVAPGTHLTTDLCLSRPEVLELIMAVEEALGLDLPDEAFVGKQFATVAGLVSLFEQAGGDANAGSSGPA